MAMAGDFGTGSGEETKAGKERIGGNHVDKTKGPWINEHTEPPGVILGLYTISSLVCQEPRLAAGVFIAEPGM